MQRLHQLRQPQPSERHCPHRQRPSWQRPSLNRCPRRGFARQKTRREQEHLLRSHIVSFRRWTDALGWTLRETAQVLKVSPRTLRQWQHDLGFAGMLGMAGVRLGQVHALGRPCQRSAPKQRNEVVALLEEAGPALGVPTLRDCFPTMARAELAHIVKRYRRVWRHRHRQPLRVLHWKVQGSVWAADFTEPPQPIDGLYTDLFAVRDLASGQQLLWLPITAADSDEVIHALASLVTRYGAPLVLKTDNGSPFSAGLLREFLDKATILPLFSPPYTPEYNGSAEAGIRSLKTRTETHASRQGHPNYWTFDNAAFAQVDANTTARPHGPSSPSPEQVWKDRPAITAQERSAFQDSVNRYRDQYRSEHDQPLVGPLTDYQQRAQDRQAIRRALEEHGYLFYSRRRIPPPIKKKKVAKIT